MSKDSPRVIMAFDFGTKNIGIAIGQEITKTASTFVDNQVVFGKVYFPRLIMLTMKSKLQNTIFKLIHSLL